MSLRFITGADKKKILAELEERFGITELNMLLIEAGRDKVRAFTGDLGKDELVALGDFTRVEIVGGYLVRREPWGLRLSFDMTQLLASKITKHIVELDDEQMLLWMKGAVVPINLEKGTYVVRWKDDFLGGTYCDGEKLLNFVPKDRRLKRTGY